MKNKDDINVSVMPTPNPDTIKFTVNESFFDLGSLTFGSKTEAANSPLPAKLFEIDTVEGVMVGTNFISVSKTPKGQWENVLEQIIDNIKDVLATNDTYLDKTLLDGLAVKQEESGEESKKIIAILNEEIRPAIAMDGGDCQFHSFVDGILTLELQGACSSCPSSTLTLKMGIENRLKQDIPTLKEVVQL